jgi:nitrous oxide reductase accessory protein NosL
VFGLPQEGSPPPPPEQPAQLSAAASAQTMSHDVSQQNGSAAQIALQHSASEQPGVVLATQQSFVFGLPQEGSPPPPPEQPAQLSAAASAQTMSHDVLQQNGSAAQIALQHSASEQPGVVLATQQSFVFGSPHCANASPVIHIAKVAAPNRTARVQLPKVIGWHSSVESNGPTGGNGATRADWD